MRHNSESEQMAWDFIKQPSYRKAVARWIMSAKQEQTRLAVINEDNKCE